MIKPILTNARWISMLLFAQLVCFLTVSVQADPAIADFQYPPQKKFEQRGAPPAWNFVWVDGYWNWENDAWVWHEGKYIQTIQDRPPIKNHDFRGMPPSKDHIWIPGSWALDEGDWTWQKGHYKIKPFRNAFWHAGYWRYQAPGWVWIEGHW